jgi:hypothetical protein
MTAITSAKSKLGFIGIGYMGRPIAQRLLAAGFRLTAYDRHRTKAEELIQYGGTVAESVAELSFSCEVVLTCLASDEAVLNFYKGADGAFANAHRGSLVIDLSTVNPQTSQAPGLYGAARNKPTEISDSVSCTLEMFGHTGPHRFEGGSTVVAARRSARDQTLVSTRRLNCVSAPTCSHNSDPTRAYPLDPTSASACAGQ